MNQLQDIQKTLAQAERVAIFTHVNPDGDALGSAYAMQAALEFLGKKATVFLEKEPPERYAFLVEDYSLCGESDAFDVALALDCGSINRLGNLHPLYLQIGKKLVVDHHYATAPYGDIYFSDPNSAACCELVYDLIIGLCGRVPEKSLVPLYTGLSTDTGNFKFSNVTVKTFTVAAALLESGVKIRPITRRLYDTVKLSKLKFIGALADHVQLYNDGKIAVLACSDSFLAGFGLAFEDLEELPNTVLSIKGVEVSVIIKEKDADKLKVSLRCKENIDLALLAAQFGGGGHACASGFVTDASAQTITDELVTVISKQLEEFYAGTSK